MPLMGPADWMGSFLIPGYAYAAVGRRPLALWMAGGWVVSALLLLVFRGHPVVSAWAIGTLASTHTSGLAFVMIRSRELSPEAPPVTLSTRIVLPLVFWIIAATVVYWPLDELITARLARGVLVDGRRVIVDPRATPASVTRGQFILYQTDGGHYGSAGQVLNFAAGFGFGEVLGLPGDTLEFSKEHFRVLDRWRSRLPHMPQSGSRSVAAGSWFVWPRFREVRNIAAPQQITEAFLDQSAVPQAEFVGRPYRRWFFWRQDMR